MRTPDFYIVGAPKCGTTAMADYLGQHPEIFMPENKDSNNLGSDLLIRHNVSHPPDKFRVDIKTFLSWYESAAPDQQLGDASVLYLLSTRAATEIKELSPDAKIIAMLRNPVDMLYSLHGHMLADLNEEVESFEDALAAEEDRKQQRRIPATCWSTSLLFYSELAKYSQQLQRYFEVFGRENVHVIIFDDLQADVRATYRRTLEFLGVSPEFQANTKVVNAAKRLRSQALMQFVVNPPWPIRPVAERLSRVVWLRNLVNSTLMRVNTVQQKRPPMAAETRHRLQKLFSAEVEQLSDLLQRDLSHWSRSQQARELEFSAG